MGAFHYGNTAHTLIYIVNLKHPIEGTKRETKLSGVGLQIIALLGTF